MGAGAQNHRVSSNARSNFLTNEDNKKSCQIPSKVAADMEYTSIMRYIEHGGSDGKKYPTETLRNILREVSQPSDKLETDELFSNDKNGAGTVNVTCDIEELG